jgi:tetratricopeptide (TPR) repeat protein
MHGVSHRHCVAGLLLFALLALTMLDGRALASGGDPVPEPTSSGGSLSPEARYNRGLAHSKQAEWTEAEREYRAAIAQRSEFPEAWNGLGHALKQQRRFDESIAAYDEALRLQPRFPQALEYLGEAYVAMGRLKDANDVLARLRRLDDGYASQLAAAIAGNTQHSAGW